MCFNAASDVFLSLFIMLVGFYGLLWYLLWSFMQTRWQVSQAIGIWSVLCLKFKLPNRQFFLFSDGIYAECLDNRVQFTIHGSLSAKGSLGVYAVSKCSVYHCLCANDLLHLGMNSGPNDTFQMTRRLYSSHLTWQLNVVTLRNLIPGVIQSSRPPSRAVLHRTRYMPL